MKPPVIALALFLAMSRTVAGQEVPVVIHDAQLKSDRLELELVNNGPSPATAWTIDVNVHRTVGGPSRHSSIGIDNYTVDAVRGLVPAKEVDAKFPQPGQPYAFSIMGSFESVPEVHVVAVVLEDGTAYGDQDVVRQVFERRTAERDAAQSVLAELRGVQRSKRGMAALVDAKARMAIPLANSPGAGMWRLADQNLALKIREAEAGRTDPDLALASVIDTVGREYQAAIKHSVKR
jgi:hypothetical protein